MTAIALTAAELIEALERLDIYAEIDNLFEEEFASNGSIYRFRSGYSGRAMYGKSCFGVTTNRYESGDVARVQLALAHYLARRDGIEDPEFDDLLEWFDKLGEPSRDSMGLGTIHYWPNVTIVAEDTE